MGTFLPALRRGRTRRVTTKALEPYTPETKAVLSSYFNALMAGGGMHDRTKPWPVERAVAEGFDRVMWVFKSVNTIATDSARLPYRIREGDEDGDPLDDHPLYRVLNKKANPLESGQVFRKRLSAQIMLSKAGAFVEETRSNSGTIIRLDLLPPGRTVPVPGTGADLIDHWKVTLNDGSERHLDVDKVRWFRDPHPLDPYSGVTPLESAGMSVELDYFSRLYNVMFMRNDGRPSTVVAVDPPSGSGEGGDMDPADMDRLEARFGKGPMEAGKMAVVSGRISVADLAARPRDMQYGTTSKNSKTEILSAFGVPESVLGYAADRCVDDQTEALTQRGWLRGDRITTDDTILSMDPVDGVLKWSPVHEVYRNPAYNGKMWRLKHRHADFLVTPGHKWAVEPRPGQGKRSPSTTDAAVLKSVENLSTHDKIVAMGYCESSVTEPAYSDAFVELVGWAVTEGHYTPNAASLASHPLSIAPYVRIRQNAGPNSERIERCAKEAGATFAVHESKGRCLVNIRGETAAALHQVAPGKIITTAFLLALTPLQRELLLQTMIDADGHRFRNSASWTFTQKDKAASEAFVFLATLSGYTTSLRQREWDYRYKGQTRRMTGWQVIVRQRRVLTVQRDTRTTEHYTGLVWCPRTDYGTFVARRHGRVVVTGNTYANADAELYTYWTRTMPGHNDIIVAGFDDDSADDLTGFLDTSKIAILERGERDRRAEAREEFAAGLRSIISYATLAGYDDEIESTPHTRALYIAQGKTPLPSTEEDAEALGLGQPEDPAAAGGAPPGAPGAAVDPAAPGEQTGATFEPPDTGAPPPPAGPTGAPRSVSSPTPPRAPDAGAVDTSLQRKDGRPDLAVVGSTKTHRARLLVERKDPRDDERETEPNLRDADRLEDTVAAALAALGPRWVERTVKRLEAPKARKGTRHWHSDGPTDTRVGTKALDADRAVDPERWADEAEAQVQGVVEAAATAAALALVADLAANELDDTEVEALVRDTVDEVVGMVRRSAQALAEGLAAELRDADEAGQSMPELATAARTYLARVSGWATTTAITVATGTTSGAREAAAAAIEAAGGRDIVRTWVSRRDNKVRDTHAYVDAAKQTRALGEPFLVGGVNLRFPGDPYGPPREVRNCFVDGTVVQARDVHRAYRREYQGDLVTLNLAGVDDLTSTPNHPVLTLRGWLPVHMLIPGDYLVGSGFRQDVGVADPHIDGVPAPIEQIVDAVKHLGPTHWATGSRVDFHGDGTEADVEVVTANRLLRVPSQAAFGEPVEHEPFTGGNPLVPGPGFGGQFAFAGDGPTASGVGGSGVCAALLDRPGGGEGAVGLNLAARLDARFHESLTDRRTRDTQIRRELLDAGASHVTVHKVLDVQVQSGAHVMVSNLETGDGLYIANGIVSHNCRCFLRHRSRQTGRFASVS